MPSELSIKFQTSPGTRHWQTMPRSTLLTASSSTPVGHTVRTWQRVLPLRRTRTKRCSTAGTTRATTTTTLPRSSAPQTDTSPRSSGRAPRRSDAPSSPAIRTSWDSATTAKPNTSSASTAHQVTFRVSSPRTSCPRRTDLILVEWSCGTFPRSSYHDGQSLFACLPPQLRSFVSRLSSMYFLIIPSPSGCAAAITCFLAKRMVTRQRADEVKDQSEGGAKIGFISCQSSKGTTVQSLSTRRRLLTSNQVAS